MIKLRHFCYADIDLLKKFRYPDWTNARLRNLVDAWNEMQYKGNYFEMFAICSDRMLVGSVSLYAKQAPGFKEETAEENRGAISAGPEIFLPYRRRGYGKEAVILAYQHAKEKGYTSAQVQIRTDNAASLALHKKLGFSVVCTYLNKKGHEVYDLKKMLREK